MSGAVLIGAVSTVLVALFGFLAVAWRLSGRIKHTDADRLWDASEKLRNEYQENLKEMKEELRGCMDRVVVLENESSKLSQENRDLRAQAIELTRANERLKMECEILRAEVKSLKEELNARPS